MADYNANAGINWPLVAGLAITGAVIYYALNIVNKQLQQADALVGGAASDVQAVVTPITSAISWIQNIPNSIAGLFGGGSPDTTNGQSDSDPDGQDGGGGSAF